MAARLNQIEAVMMMLKAGARPLTPYPGNNHIGWQCQCTTCGRVITPTRLNVSQGHAACAYCVGLRIEAGEAVAEMRERGFEPRTPFVSAKDPWSSTHVACGHEVAPTLGSLRRGQGGCGYCAKKRVHNDEIKRILDEADLDPVEDFPGSVSHDWLVRHRACGRTLYVKIRLVRRNGVGCRVCAALDPDIKGPVRITDHDEATAVMTAKGWEPLEAFVNASAKWKCRHLECGNINHVAMSQVVNADYGSCRECGKIKAARTKAQRNAKDPAILDIVRVLSLEPYPGHSKAPWRVRHLDCGREITTKWNSIQQAAKTGKSVCRECALKDRDRRMRAQRTAGAA